MKKRVLIISYSMGIGGVERALLGLLSAVDYSQINLTLKLAQKEGELLSLIPEEVKVEQIDSIRNNWDLFNKPLIPQIISNLKRPKTFVKGILIGIDYLYYKLHGHYHSLYRNHIEKEPLNYDLAISYAGPSSLLDYYVAKCVTATKKVAWVHYDLNKFTINYRSLNHLYRYFDRIFIVSEDSKKIFDSTFPNERDRSYVFHNLICPQEIKRLANMPMKTVLPHQGLNCVIVGRLSHEKGQDVAIYAITNLINKGIEINLIIVGEGKFRRQLEELVQKLGVSDRIIFVGGTLNPYPFMSQCDIYLQTSRHEGYCITISEAKLFGMPIVATDFTGAHEQLKDYTNGFITSHDSKAVACAIEKVISENLYQQRNPAFNDNQADYQKLAELFL